MIDKKYINKLNKLFTDNQNSNTDLQNFPSQIDIITDVDKESQRVKIKNRYNDIFQNTGDKNDKSVKTNSQDFLLFVIGSEYYCILLKDIDCMKENIKITKVPLVPEYIEGIINFRGRIITILNLEIIFGITKNNNEEMNSFIITEDIGFRINKIIDVINLDKFKFKNIFKSGHKALVDCIDESIELDNNIYQLIDINKLVKSHLVQGEIENND